MGAIITHCYVTVTLQVCFVCFHRFGPDPWQIPPSIRSPAQSLFTECPRGPGTAAGAEGLAAQVRLSTYEIVMRIKTHKHGTWNVY